MLSLDLLIAVVLITTPEIPPTADYPPCRLNTLQAVALSMELMDPRERHYTLARQEDADADIKCVRRRYAELVDAPYVVDALRFPSRQFVTELLAFNRSYRGYLCGRQRLDILDYGIASAIEETDYLYAIWDRVRDASCDYYYVTVRRAALKKLREAIGYSAYCNGCLPPHIPIWRFQVIGE